MAMITSGLSEYIYLIKEHLPSALIDNSQWEKIVKVGDIIPSAATTFFGFESRLGVLEAKADFLFCADATEAGRRVLAANAYGIDLPKVLFDHPVWQNLRRFSTNWDSEASVLHEQVRNIWLEFDTATDDPETIPIPSCFFGPEAIFSTPALAQNHPYAYVWEAAIPLLLGRDLPNITQQILMSCIEYLPEKAYIFQVGLMLARNSDAVRICVRDIAPHDVVSYLKRLNWSGNSEKLMVLLNEVSQFTDRIDLDIDITDRVHPKIGLECYLHKQPKFDDRWNDFFNYLVMQGHCVLQKYQALWEYPGYIRQKMASKLWPSGMRKLGGLLGSNYEWVIFKGIHHIKLVYQEDHVHEAKAYLYTSRSLISSIVKEPEQNT